jgi:hypothetical protein
MIGEAFRDRLYGPAPKEGQSPVKSWRLYSGLFIVVRQKIPLTNHEFRSLLNLILVRFSCLLFGDVRTHVST